MPVRRVALFLGDKAMAGTRPASEIPSGMEVSQTDCQIWNQQAGAWQNMQPGVNTNPSAVGTDRWSIESRYREAIRTQFPTGTHYVIKHALDSMAGHTSTKPSWLPNIAGNAFASLVTIITNAAAAANLADDTLSIDLIVACFVTDDWKTEATTDAYSRNLQGIIQTLRQTILGIPYCTLGQLGSSQVVLVETHYGFVGLSHTQQYQLMVHRASVADITFPPLFNMQLLRTHSLTAAPDNESFSAASVITLGQRLGQLLFPTALSDGANPEAPIVGFFGDSILEGSVLNSALPAHLATPMSGVSVLEWKKQVFETFQAGVNNLVSLDAPTTPIHGPDVYLSELLRALWRQIWVVKGTSIGSTAYFWGPHYLGYFFDATIRGWLRNSVQILRAQSKKPVPKLIVVSLGTNDIIENRYPAEDVARVLHTFIKNVEYELSLENVDISGLKFVLLVPRSTIAASATRRSLVREQITALKEVIPNLELVDLDNHSSDDGIHLNASGEDSVAQDIFDVFRSVKDDSIIEPLFAPNRKFLTAALKLSQVPIENDGYTQIDASIQEVRTRFYQHLGEARVAELKTLPYVANAVTQAQQLRALAVTTEIKWCRYLLLRTMPTIFKSGTTMIQTWDVEGGFREDTYLKSREELKRLENEILDAVQTLRNSTLTSSGQVSMTALGPDSPPSPGDTVFKVI